MRRALNALSIYFCGSDILCYIGECHGEVSDNINIFNSWMDSIYLGCIFSCESLSLTDGIGINIKAQSQMQLINFGEVVFKSDIYGGVEIKLVDFGGCDPIS